MMPMLPNLTEESRSCELFFWLPRILGFLYAGFLAMFAFDVFSENTAILQTINAFAIHLIPSIVSLILVALLWRWQFVGGVLLIAAGCSYATMVGWRALFVLVIGAPMFVIGILFVIDGWVEGRLKEGSEA
jgi:hypothetical protein